MQLSLSITFPLYFHYYNEKGFILSKMRDRCYTKKAQIAPVMYCYKTL